MTIGICTTLVSLTKFINQLYILVISIPNNSRFFKWIVFILPIYEKTLLTCDLCILSKFVVDVFNLEKCIWKLSKSRSFIFSPYIFHSISIFKTWNRHSLAVYDWIRQYIERWVHSSSYWQRSKKNAQSTRYKSRLLALRGRTSRSDAFAN